MMKLLDKIVAEICYRLLGSIKMLNKVINYMLSNEKIFLPIIFVIIHGTVFTGISLIAGLGFEPWMLAVWIIGMGIVELVKIYLKKRVKPITMTEEIPPERIIHLDG